MYGNTLLQCLKARGNKNQMSRIGNKPIEVPQGVEVKIDGNHITVKGPKGTLEKDLHKNMDSCSRR